MQNFFIIKHIYYSNLKLVGASVGQCTQALLDNK